MNSQLLQSHCYARTPVPVEASAALNALRQLLAGAYAGHTAAWAPLTDALRGEGLLPYFAYRLLQSAVTLDDSFRQALKKELLQREAEKLSDDSELARIFAAVAQRGIPMLVLKGEALARSLYPSAACRPTGDYDLLVQPQHLPAAQVMFQGLGYQPGAFHGQHILAQQSWICPAQVRGRTFQVDLHWDITNQRFFRRRLPLSALWNDAQAIAVAGGEVIAPSHPHALLIACTHLAADLPGTAIQLKWLLDIHLLLEALNARQVEALIAQARTWGLLDVLVFYCRLAESALITSAHTRQFELASVKQSNFKGRCYRWAIDHRWFDLLEYGLRLPGFAARRAYFKEIMDYRKIRSARVQQHSG